MGLYFCPHCLRKAGFLFTRLPAEARSAKAGSVLPTPAHAPHLRPMKKSTHIQVLEGIGAALLGIAGVLILTLAFIVNAVTVIINDIRRK